MEDLDSTGRARFPEPKGVNDSFRPPERSLAGPSPIFHRGSASALTKIDALSGGEPEPALWLRRATVSGTWSRDGSSFFAQGGETGMAFGSPAGSKWRLQQRAEVRCRTPRSRRMAAISFDAAYMNAMWTFAPDTHTPRCCKTRNCGRGGTCGKTRHRAAVEKREGALESRFQV
jgi:hypothetical protein